MVEDRTDCWWSRNGTFVGPSRAKNAKYHILAYYSRRAAVIENFLQPIDRPVAHVLFQKGDP